MHFIVISFFCFMSLIFIAIWVEAKVDKLKAETKQIQEETRGIKHEVDLYIKRNPIFKPGENS